MDQNITNQNTLIYQMEESDGEQNDVKSDISTKSNQNKIHQQDTQVSEVPNQHYQHTQIIKIKPNHSEDNTQITINNLIQTSQTIKQKKQCLIFSQSSQQKHQHQQTNQDQDLQSPAKLYRTKRKRQLSANKSNRRSNSNIKNKKEVIFDDDCQQQLHVDEERNVSVKREQSVNCSNKLNKLKQKQFDQVTIQKSSPPLSYLQLQDSQRCFDLNKEFNKCFLLQKRKNITNEKEYNHKVQYQREYQCEYQSNQFQQRYDREHQKQQQQFVYQHNDNGEQQQDTIISTINQKHQLYNHKQQDYPIKIISKLPKQITIQTSIYTLVNNPIPKGLKLSCSFIINKKYMGLSTQYNLLINSNHQCILSAKKQHFSFTSSKFIISINQNYITKRKDNTAFIGRLVSNFSGTQYELMKRSNINNKIKQTHKKYSNQQNNKNYQNEDQQQQQQQQHQTLQSIISFQQNLWGYNGMRRLNIIKLNKQKLTQKDNIRRVNFQQVYERGQQSKLMKIQTCKPTYNKTTQRYSVDFGNKNKILPSNKNIILEYKQQVSMKQQRQKQRVSVNRNSSNRGQVDRQKSLMIAKQKDDRYLVQVGYPLSLYEAFAICLANNDSKLLVN